MIVLASGHAGVDGFVSQLELHDAQVAKSWAEAQPLWTRARKVLLGEGLNDFGQALEWLRKNPPDRTVVLWIGANTALPEWIEGQDAIHVWRGEIDGAALRAWCRDTARGFEDLPPVWSVVSLFPYPSPASLVQTLSPLVSNHYGRKGLWVDNDWGLASLTMTLAPARLERHELPGKLQPLANGGGLLVPAAPPWLPGTARPGLDDIRGWIRGAWDWQGWWMGGRLADERGAEILSQIPTVLFWGSAATPESVFQRSWDIVRLLQPQAECWMVSDGSLPSWANEDRWVKRTVALGPSDERPAVSTQRWWGRFRQKKGALH